MAEKLHGTLCKGTLYALLLCIVSLLKQQCPSSGRGQGAPGPRPAATVQSGAPGQQYGPPMQQAPPAGQVWVTSVQ